MSQVFFVFRWYLVVQIFGLAVLPLCLVLFRHLPDRGYGVSKPLGLLLTGWAFWLSTSFGWTHNTAGSIASFLVLLAAVGLLLYFSSSVSLSPVPPASLSHWLRNRWRGVLTTELLFVLAFLAWCLVRAHMPRILTAGGEKWMEIAFLRAILRSDFFPPHDPWLSGFAISYYYFGYIIIAMITRLAAVPPSIAFNLGIVTLFSFTCIGAFSLVYNLIAMCARSSDESREPLGKETGEEKTAVAGGLLGPLVVGVMGNLEGLLEMLHARGIGPASFWQWLDIRSLNVPPPPFAEGSCIPTRFFWWWQASRTLHDYAPWGAEQEVIDEFPVFSFILGDMHPHVLALPFVLLALVLALDLYVRMSGAQEEGIEGGELREVDGARRVTDLRSALRSLRSFPLTMWEFLVYALCLGGLGFLNTWDFPIYLFVVVVAYPLAYTRTMRRTSRIIGSVLRSAILFISLFITGLVLYSPFWIGLRSQAGGLLLNLFNATRLPQFLVMFGPLVFVMISFVADQARRSGVGIRTVVRWTLIASFSIFCVLVLTLAVAVVLIWLGVSPLQGSTVYVAAWLRGEPIPGLGDVVNARDLISSSLLLRLLNPWTALALIAVLVTVLLVLRERIGTRGSEAVAHDRQSAGHDFVLLLFATGALLTLGVEYVYLRDNFGVRMNTVFKFYFQAWIMWAIAGAYALAGFFRRDSAGRRVGMVVALVAVLLVAAGLVYPTLAIPARAREYGGLPTLDGASYLAETKPDDYAAIAWLNENVAGTPIILEAPADHFQAYVYEGRVSAHTGLPTLLGWAGHESQWRGDYTEQALREADIETLYTSVDSGEVLTLLEKYSISYVYVGPLERARYPAAGLAKFASLMEPVYDTGAVTIYSMTDDKSDQSSKSTYQ